VSVKELSLVSQRPNKEAKWTLAIYIEKTVCHFHFSLSDTGEMRGKNRQRYRVEDLDG
jgi:hypothetical protein